ncbi:MAG: tripartite tricarboxylate transporter substrate binding protein [Pusillimonas sp.]
MSQYPSRQHCRPLGAAILTTMAVAFCAQPALAAEFPDKPITLVVGFSPGGSNDIAARAIAKPLSESLGVSVVVENKVGAAGMIATNYVARSKPDGYTLMVSSASPLVVTPHTATSVSYDARKDFSAISLIGITPETLALNPKVPAKTLKEVVELANKQQLTLASSGTGGLPHLAIELFKSAAGGNIVHVPYKGAAPAVTDTLAGHVNGVVVDLPAVYKHIQSGGLTGVAMANDKRSEFLPDLPTSGEQGMPSFVAVNWIGLIAPAGTPEPIIKKLHLAVLDAARQEDVKQQMAQAAVEVSTSPSPANFQTFITDEYEKWGEIVKASNVKAAE